MCAHPLGSGQNRGNLRRWAGLDTGSGAAFRLSTRTRSQPKLSRGRGGQTPVFVPHDEPQPVPQSALPSAPPSRKALYHIR